MDLSGKPTRTRVPWKKLTLGWGLPDGWLNSGSRSLLYRVYLGLMVTVNELFAGFESVPVKLATPVSAMEPACVAITLIVTVIVEPPFRVEVLQLTVPPAAPGAGVEQVPRDVLADENCRLGGRLLVKTTALAAVFWLFLIAMCKYLPFPLPGRHSVLSR